ncbi:hypothetical protein MASR2M15_06610 [Anaerolineales bacterium]
MSAYKTITTEDLSKLYQSMTKISDFERLMDKVYERLKEAGLQEFYIGLVSGTSWYSQKEIDLPGYKALSKENSSQITLNGVDLQLWHLPEGKKADCIMGVEAGVFERPDLQAIWDLIQLIAERENNKHLLRSQYDFVRIICHDLRSPLTSIKGFTDMLESGSAGELTETQLQFISKILNNIDYMTNLIKNVHHAGRYDPAIGYYELSLDSVDISDMTYGLVMNRQLDAQLQNQSIHFEAEHVPILMLDETVIESAIRNLIDNALKYSTEGARIVVSVKQTDTTVRITVTDNGIGIPAEDHEKIFDRHYRVKRTNTDRRRIKGSGLGLFIVKSAVEHHGGSIEIDSEIGKGTSITLVLPIREADGI